VTPDELEAIERLVAITNMDKTMAAQAYFAMDKNEELALNYLLDHGGEDEDD